MCHFKMVAVRHLGFLKVEISISGPVRGCTMRHYAKFCEDRSNRSRDMADFRFSRWRPSAILDLFYAFWDHVTFVITSLVFRCRAVVACIHSLFGVVYSRYNAHSLNINMYIYYTVGHTAHISYNAVLLHSITSLPPSRIHSPSPL